MSFRPLCRYQPACPGCPRFDRPGVEPEQAERLERFSEEFCGPPVEVMPGGGRGYRCRVRLSVRGHAGRSKIGIFEAGSHRLVSIPHCPVHHPAIADLLPRCAGWLNESHLEPYDEANHTGLLRGIQMAVERSSQTVQVVLLLNHDLRDVRRLSTKLLQLEQLLSQDSRVHSIWLAALPARTNSLFAERYLLRFGPDMLEDECGGAAVFFPPDAFGQANLEEHDRVVRRIHASIGAGESVCEYYAGVGTIGLGLAQRGQSVRFNELGAGSVLGLRRGWERLFGADRRAPIHVGSAGALASLYSTNEVVIVDPPRKGLDRELFNRLCERPPRRLIYLSCGLDALLRESRELLVHGGYSLQHISAWSYFPFTRHVETLVVLDGPVVRA